MAEQHAPELLRDPVSYARLLKDVHAAVLSGARAPRAPRSVVSASWERSLAARVDPDRRQPPVVYEGSELADVRSAHPLASVIPLLRQTLVSIAEDAEHIMIVTDAQGRILWREGATDVRRRADSVRLTEGTSWAEEAIGTNAMGTTLATGEPVQIYSAEHLVRMCHSWTCAAAPLRDPETGALLGAIDVSGPLRTVHPAMLALVSTSASLAEGQLRADLAVRDERLRQANMPHLRRMRGQPGALLSSNGRVLAAESCPELPEIIEIHGDDGTITLPDGRLGIIEPLSQGYLLRLGGGAPTAAAPRPKLTLRLLTESEPEVIVDGRKIPISLRHAEILALLTLHPAGLNADKLALQLYGDTGNPVTVRAEIHRLRAQLGTVLRTRPYRLAGTVDADFLRARDAIRGGAIRKAAREFRGELLPGSESPTIREERDALTAAVRRAALDSSDDEALWQYWNTPCGTDDIEVIEKLCTSLRENDPRRVIVTTHLDRIDKR